jgi:hypothetical protein
MIPNRNILRGAVLAAVAACAAPPVFCARTARAAEPTVAKPADENRAIASAMKGMDAATTGGVRIGYAFSAAQGWYVWQGGALMWRDPVAGETHHLAVTVQDAQDRRTIPGCRVTASFTDPQGRSVATSSPLAFTWGDDFHRYAANVSLPAGTSRIRLTLRVEPPEFPRTGRPDGPAFTAPVSVSFADAEIPAPSVAPAPGYKPRPVFPAGRHPAVTATPYPGSAGAVSAVPDKSDR